MSEYIDLIQAVATVVLALGTISLAWSSWTLKKVLNELVGNSSAMATSLAYEAR
jgi:hypothetical protein